MEIRNIKGQPCLSEKDLMREAGTSAAVFTFIADTKGIAYYNDRDGKKFYPLCSVLEFMCGVPKPDYSRIADVAKEICGSASLERKAIEDIKAIVNELGSTAKPSENKKTVYKTKEDLLSENRPYNQNEAAVILGVSSKTVANYRKKNESRLSGIKNLLGQWLYSREDINLLRQAIDEARGKFNKVSGLPDPFGNDTEQMILPL